MRLARYTATVMEAALTTGLLGRPTLVVRVKVANRDDQAQPYNIFDWRVQDGGGRVLDPTVSARGDDLGSGDLVPGGEATGTVSFEVAGPGTYYVIYKPKPFDAARGIWQVVV